MAYQQAEQYSACWYIEIRRWRILPYLTKMRAVYACTDRQDYRRTKIIARGSGHDMSRMPQSNSRLPDAVSGLSSSPEASRCQPYPVSTNDRYSMSALSLAAQRCGANVSRLSACDHTEWATRITGIAWTIPARVALWTAQVASSEPGCGNDH